MIYKLLFDCAHFVTLIFSSEFRASFTHKPIQSIIYSQSSLKHHLLSVQFRASFMHSFRIRILKILNFFNWILISIMMMMIWYFTSLSILFRSHYNEGVIRKALCNELTYSLANSNPTNRVRVRSTNKLATRNASLIFNFPQNVRISDFFKVRYF